MPAKPKHPTLKAAEKIMVISLNAGEKIMNILSDLPEDQAEIVLKLVRNLWEKQDGTVPGIIFPNKSPSGDVTNF